MSLVSFSRAALAIVAVVLGGCRGSIEHPEAHDLSDLNRPGTRIAVLADSRDEDVARGFFTFAKVWEFPDLPMAATAMLGGRVEAIVGDEHALRRLIAAHPDRFRFLPAPLDEAPAVVHVASDRTNLVAQINGFNRRLRSSGLYDDMLARWCYDTASPEMPQVADELHPRGTLRIGISALSEPLSYLDGNGEAVGFDVEYARRLALDRHMACQLYLMPPASLRQALSGGLLDLVIDGWTAEMAPSGTWVSNGYLDCDIRVIVPRTDSAAREMAFSNFTDGLCTGFMNSFVTDSRWRLVLYGLWLTVMMTFLSALIGGAAAFVVCAMRMSHRKTLRRIAAGYITVLQGTPVLIVLLMLSYIVFSGTGVDGTVSAVITLSLWFSANAAEVLRSGIMAVPRGQYEAARALGFSPWRAFFELVLPQALRVSLPVLCGCVVHLLQQTSVVGYIAVLDLTMAVDLLCGRSAEALIPLVATGATYFLVSWLTVETLNLCGRFLDPSWRRRHRKGGGR